MEREPLKERESQKIPVDLIFWRHVPENAGETFNILEKTIEDRLQTDSFGKVLTIIEDFYRPLSSSKIIQRLVKDGVLPSTAYAAVTFIEKNERLPDTGKELASFKRKILRGKENESTRLELQALDNLYIEYSGRIEIVWEGAPFEEVKSRPNEQKKFRKSLLRAHRLTREGKFDEALPFFKKATYHLASKAKKREKALVEQISEAVRDNQIIGIVGCFGDAHTPLAHLLKSSGYDVRMIFPEKDQGIHVYDPGTVITRISQFFPERKISELEWLKGLTGEVLHDLARTLGLSGQKAARMVHQALANFPDLDSVKEFEKKVGEMGFAEAVETYL